MSISNGVPATAANLNAAFVSLSAENTFPEEQTYEKGLLVKEIATPATPASGYLAVYAKTDGEAYVKNDAGTETQISNVPQTRIVVPPTIRTFTSGSGTYYATFNFAITSGSATVGATYTNNGNTYTVLSTIASQVYLACTGTAAPTASGTLTKSAGTGDSTITFQTVYKPTVIRVRLAGGGGGGGGSGTTGMGAVGAGVDTTFGSSLLTGSGGAAAHARAGGGTSAGGAASLGTGPMGIAIPGGNGSNYGEQVSISGALNAGGMGGSNMFGGGGGGGGGAPSAGKAGATNSGAGGGGGGAGNAAGSAAGGGGGAGGTVDAIILNPSASYAYAVGGGGAGGSAGSFGAAGGAGAAGIIVITEVY